jgi:5-hydroxyisourate hydrolase
MISTQVIDTSIGRPATSVPVVLDYFVPSKGWQEFAHDFTDADGIIEHFGEDAPAAGIYRLTYDIAAYQTDPFFPTIGITFEITQTADDCHLALHLSPFGYSVARG